MEITQVISMDDVRGVDVFAGIPDDDLRQIAVLCTHRTYKAGEYCAVQGKSVDYLLVVSSGKVAVEMRVDVLRHSYTVTVATLTKGHVGAWSALVPPRTLTASLKCLENSQVTAIAASDLQRIFKESPSIEAVVMRNLAAVISSRLTDSRTQLTRLIVEIAKEGIKLGR